MIWVPCKIMSKSFLDNKCVLVLLTIIWHLLRQELLLWWNLRQQRERARVFIWLLVQGSVRIRVRIRVGVRFNIKIFVAGPMRYRREFVTSAPLSWMSVHAEPLRMSTNVVDFMVIRRLYHREWNWLPYAWTMTTDKGSPRVTSYFYSALSPEGMSYIPTYMAISTAASRTEDAGFREKICAALKDEMW